MAGKVVDRDRGFKRFVANWRRVVASSRRGGPSVTVGVQGEEAKSEHDAEKGTITNVMLMIIHEFGAPAANIPARSPIRSTIDKNMRKYRKMIRDSGLKILRGKAAHQALFILGETARADIIKAIEQMEIKQDLAESTKRRRGEEGPALKDTGILINAISSVVHT